MAGKANRITETDLKTGKTRLPISGSAISAITAAALNLGVTLLAAHSCAEPAQGAPLNSTKAPDAHATTIVSFAPSNTELLYSLGAENNLVGCCSCCDYPAPVKNLTRAGTFVSVNLERMARLKPNTVLLVNGQEPLAGMLSHNGYHTVTLKNYSLRDISRNLRAISTLTGHAARGELIATAFDNSLKDLSLVIAKAARHPTVLMCVWPDPLLTVGSSSYLNDVLTACGGTSISSNLANAYPHFSLERLVLANPDVLILPFEARGKTFLTRPPWSSLQASKTQHIFFLPDAQHDGLARPTLRITSGILWLAQKLHPDLSSELNGWFARSEKSLKDAMSAKLP